MLDINEQIWIKYGTDDHWLASYFYVTLGNLTVNTCYSAHKMNLTALNVFHHMRRILLQFYNLFIYKYHSALWVIQTTKRN
jgi:hypothetical protein